MSAAILVAQTAALDPERGDQGPMKTLSISTAVSQDSPSSTSSPSPASGVSPSSVSTPTSCAAVPPIAIRPGTSTKATVMTGMAASAIVSSAPGPPSQGLSMTTKEWVIPPRPKPGRKPATDTPPTKRKAQNRAAQRAFRERRAARVGELEEQLEEEKVAHERAVRELQERISYLEVERQTLHSRCQWLESMLEQERQGRASVSPNWDNPEQQGPTRNGNTMSAPAEPQSSATGLPQPMRPTQPTPRRDLTTRPVPIAEPRPLALPLAVSQMVSPADETPTVDLGCGRCQNTGSCACAEDALRVAADMSMGCGKCSLGTRCQCLEETLGVSVGTQDLKRPPPPSSPSLTSPNEKRQRSGAGIEMETDFTGIFSVQNSRTPAQSIFPPPPPAEQPQLQHLESVEPRDRCGFCKEGTYCVCADSMVAPGPLAGSAGQHITEQTQTRTPPPSDDDVAPAPMEVTATGAIKLPGPRSLPRSQAAKLPSTAAGCGPNGPGTCAQCLADPKSGLFCRSLAANFNRNNPAGSGGCCGGGGPGGCCKAGLQPPQADALPPATAAARPRPGTGAGGGFGLSLSCADAYKTLSSHRHFDEAADDIGSWLPKLKALPVPRPGPAGGRGGRDGRAPIEVEAASIMSVLKDFDVRFGRGE